MRLKLYKLLSVLLAVCLVVAFIPATARAAEVLCDTEEEFRRAVANADIGDTIVITDDITFTSQGSYTADSQLQITNPNPFTITTENEAVYDIHCMEWNIMIGSNSDVTLAGGVKIRGGGVPDNGTITVSGTLTLEDSASVDRWGWIGSPDIPCIYIADDGTVNMKGGNLIEGRELGRGVYVAGGTLNMEAGNVYIEGPDAVGIDMASGAVDISGGVINSSDDARGVNAQGGDLTVRGQVEINGAVRIMGEALAEISGGAIVNESCGVDIQGDGGAYAEISGEADISGGEYGVYIHDHGRADIIGGAIEGGEYGVGVYIDDYGDAAISGEAHISSGGANVGVQVYKGGIAKINVSDNLTIENGICADGVPDPAFFLTELPPPITLPVGSGFEFTLTGAQTEYEIGEDTPEWLGVSLSADTHTVTLNPTYGGTDHLVLESKHYCEEMKEYGYLTLYIPVTGEIPVCEIVNGEQYTTLDEALDNVGHGDTIRLLSDIDFNGGIVIENMTITFDLNGHTLELVNTAGEGLRVQTGAVNLAGSGEFNVTGTTIGVIAANGSAVVSNANATVGNGALALTDGSVTVTGDAEGANFGVCAEGSGSSVSVGDDVHANRGARVIQGGTITIDGSIYADSIYLWIGDGDVDEDGYADSTTKPGYRTYTDGTSTVWVKISGDDTVPDDANSGITNQTRGAYGSRQVTLTITVQNAEGNPLAGIGPEYFEVLINGDPQRFDTSSLLSGFADNGDGTYTMVFTGAADSAIYPFTNFKVKDVLIEAGPTMVTTPRPADDYACEIVGGGQHAALGTALEAASSGDTIRLLQDIDYEGGLVINSKHITFDVNGYTLNINNEAGTGLVVENGGSVDLADTSPEGGGKCNVTGKIYGVKADHASVTVTGVATTGPGSIGVFANNNSSINTGSVRGVQFAAYACGGSSIEVGGDVTAVASNGKGTYADDNSEISVSGNVTATGGAASIGAHAIRSSEITVDGVITATTYIKIGDVSVLEENHTGIDGSYYVYTDAASPGNTVRVRILPLTIITGSLPDGKAGIAYSHAVTATGVGAITFSLLNGSLPAGLSLDPVTGLISGTPVAFGTYTFTVRAENSAGVFNKEFTITIAATSSGGGGTFSPPAPEHSAMVEGAGISDMTLPVDVDTAGGSASVKLEALAEEPFVVTMPLIPGINAYTLGITAALLSGSEAGDALTFVTGIGSLTLPGNMLSGTGLTGSAGITIGEGDKEILPDDVKSAIGDKPLIQLTLSIDGRQTDWRNPAAPVTVSIPYTPTEEELANPESIIVWYIDGAGNVVTIPNGHYNPATGMITFETTHFSDYAAAYKKVSFNDVATGTWYYNAVSFIAAREITTGTGSGNYSPDAKLTREDFLVMMMRAYNIVPDTNPNDNFSDAGSTYYTNYLAAAKRLGISAGVGNNMYAPGKEITRQEMFTLLYNILKVIGQLPKGNSGKTLSDFSDVGAIASYAQEAMAYLTEAGVISGSNSLLTPVATTTRAQMAQVLYNLMAK
ncbi:MAG: S-layer homology domain-containing protein [Syntrophomonadaceae bacterium]|nr:S-layer homology domain-containing protein [Syntrophomonadaceae bacterium]